MRLLEGMNGCPRCNSCIMVGVEAFMSNPPKDYHVRCLKCKLTIGPFDTKEEAIKIWNFLELAFK